MSIKIIKNKAIPSNTKKAGRKLKYPFDALTVGDCFEIAVTKEKNVKNFQAQIATAARAWAERHKERTKEKTVRVFITRQISGGEKIGVWRVK